MAIFPGIHNTTRLFVFSKFVVHSCLFVFSILFTLRIDEIIRKLINIMHCCSLIRTQFRNHVRIQIQSHSCMDKTALRLLEQIS